MSPILGFSVTKSAKVEEDGSKVTLTVTMEIQVEQGTWLQQIVEEHKEDDELVTNLMETELVGA